VVADLKICEKNETTWGAAHLLRFKDKAENLGLREKINVFE
jgi:hypothetical protein